MNVNNENKLQELSLYVNINLNNMNIQKQQNAKTYNKDNNSLNNINKIKRKVNIMNYNQRELQSRISDIQIQETKIEEMEKTLQDAKNIYSENIKNEKKESGFSYGSFSNAAGSTARADVYPAGVHPDRAGTHDDHAYPCDHCRDCIGCQGRCCDGSRLRYLQYHHRYDLTDPDILCILSVLFCRRVQRQFQQCNNCHGTAYTDRRVRRFGVSANEKDDPQSGCCRGCFSVCRITDQYGTGDAGYLSLLRKKLCGRNQYQL